MTGTLDLRVITEPLSEQQLDSDPITTTLHSLVKDIPPQFRIELDRCYHQGFTQAFLERYASEQAANLIDYFTETPQNDRINELGIGIFKLLVGYGGNIGQSLRTLGRTQEQSRILEIADQVFSYRVVHEK